ncbi:unnamed protein product [Owenia fusiformis]|uniref:Uncharacterized protein n=1 Tax=Owenia fusiformis TaxID=6347 RepID=A0A8J1XZC9_OWEFU|nr:unnamed protein product [Owenia fusiformis]
MTVLVNIVLFICVPCAVAYRGPVTPFIKSVKRNMMHGAAIGNNNPERLINNIKVWTDLRDASRSLLSNAIQEDRKSNHEIGNGGIRILDQHQHILRNVSGSNSRPRRNRKLHYQDITELRLLSRAVVAMDATREKPIQRRFKMVNRNQHRRRVQSVSRPDKNSAPRKDGNSAPGPDENSAPSPDGNSAPRPDENSVIRPDDVSELCWDHWTHQQRGLELFRLHEWAFVMDDARGKVPPGMFEGNLHMIGNYDECLSVKVNMTEYIETIPDSKAHFRGRYCTCEATIDISLEDLGIPIDIQPIFWIGECMPSTCNESEINAILREELYESDDFFDNVLGDILQFNTTCPRDMNIFENPRPSAVGVLIAILFLTVFVLIGTIYDQIVSLLSEPSPNNSSSAIEEPNKGHYNKGYYSENETNGSATMLGYATTNGSATANGSVTTNGYGTDYNPTSGPDISRKDLLHNILISFSIRRNINKVLNMDVVENGVPACINGIRVLSMAWLILGLSYILGVLYAETYTTQNLLAALFRVQRFSFQPILNAGFCADTFFLLTGVIVTIYFMKFLDNNNGSWNISRIITQGVYYVFHRWWRLTPLYVLFIFCFSNLFDYIGNGPLWPNPDPTNANLCRDNGWANVLYINNIYKPRDGCMIFTFFLTCSMQFYVISPLLLLPLYYFPAIGAVLLFLCLGSNLTALGVINGQLETRNYTDDFAYADDFFHEVIITPWCRVGPHIVGIACGYIIYRLQSQNIVIKFRGDKIAAVAGWCVSLVFITSVTFGTYSQFNEHTGEEWSSTIRVFYETVAILAWSLGVGWIIVACSMGYGGIINSILSWKAWVPLSRLSFAAHLTYPLVMFSYNYQRRSLIYVSDANMVYFFLGHFCLTYAVSLGFTLLIELPTRQLEKAFREYFTARRNFADLKQVNSIGNHQGEFRGQQRVYDGKTPSVKSDMTTHL